jgi:hypothetical protein
MNEIKKMFAVEDQYNGGFKVVAVECKFTEKRVIVKDRPPATGYRNVIGRDEAVHLLAETPEKAVALFIYKLAKKVDAKRSALKLAECALEKAKAVLSV